MCLQAFLNRGACRAVSLVGMKICTSQLKQKSQNTFAVCNLS